MEPKLLLFTIYLQKENSAIELFEFSADFKMTLCPDTGYKEEEFEVLANKDEYIFVHTPPDFVKSQIIGVLEIRRDQLNFFKMYSKDFGVRGGASNSILFFKGEPTKAQRQLVVERLE